jgi:hypothetical protein
MSVVDGLSREQLEQLRQDALLTRTTLITSGWVPGELMKYVRADIYTSIDELERVREFGLPHGDFRIGESCMSGAAGRATEGNEFIDWVISNHRCVPTGFDFAPHSQLLMRLIAEVGTDLYPDDFEGEKVSSLDDAINRTVNVNDGCLGPKTNEGDLAVAWIDAVLRCINNALELLPAPVPVATEYVNRLLAEENGEGVAITPSLLG